MAIPEGVALAIEHYGGQMWSLGAGHDARVAAARAALVQAIEQAIADEREAIARQARYYAGHYPAHSDGCNTFFMLAEWIEARS